MKPLAVILACAAAAAAGLQAQSPSLTCTPTAVPALVHQEGITERVGDIVLSCTAGPVGGAVTGNLTVFLSVNITNRLVAGAVTGASVTIDGASPTTLASTAALQGPNTIAFNALRIPVTASQGLNLRISGIRANASQVASTFGARPITAALSFDGVSLLAGNPQLTVGFPSRSLGYTSQDTGLRFTEKYASSLEGRAKSQAAGADTGTRVIVSFSNFPDGVTLSVPVAIAGSSASVPTASGNFGAPATGGQYTPGAPGGSLLLSLVTGADSSGAGGVPAFTPTGIAPINLTGVASIPLTNGAGFAVYEVLDENPNVRESAQMSLGFTAAAGCCRDSQPQVSVSVGPVSTVLQADVLAPIPRFIASPAAGDCDDLQDCDAGYFPHLVVDPLAVQFTAPSGGDPTFRFIRVLNAGGGELSYQVSITYTGASGWLTYDSGMFKLTASPKDLAPGVYQASVLFDAGPIAGSKAIAVTFTVTPPGTPPPSNHAPLVTAVVNAANWRPGPLQAGSIATLFGDRFAPRPEVLFDGFAARVLWSDNFQINLFVPSELAGRSSASVTVTTGNGVGVPFPVTIAPFAPAIFGALNQDYRLNTRFRPADTGSVLQIFLTGADAPPGSLYTVKIHDRDNLVPVYAGPAPGIPGLQQVNAVIPADLPAMQSEAVVCVAPPTAGAARTCGLPLTIWLEKP